MPTRRIRLTPDDLRHELRFAVRHLGRRVHTDLGKRDMTMEMLLDAIAQRLDKLEIVRVVQDDPILRSAERETGAG